MSYRYPYTPSDFVRFSAGLFFLPVLAQAVTWDGSGAPNSSGTWEAAGNWSADAVPLFSDSVVLGDVTSGTRTVTVSSGFAQTINDLTITQTTGGAVNKLSVAENLTVMSTGNPLVFTSSAGQGGIVVDIAAGKTFSASRTSGSLNINLDGSFNLGVGSVFAVSTTTASANAGLALNGPITAAANSSIKVSGDSASLTLNGATSLATGAKIQLEYLNSQGNALFTNNSTLSMDGAALDFVWNATTSNSPGVGRNFTNTGDWTLANGSSVILSSTTGRPASGGNNTGTNNHNSGVMRVASGSTVSSRTAYNTGTLQLGSQTAGISDTLVSWGLLAISNIELHNGRNPAGSTGAGTINVLGNALFGHTAANGTAYLYNGSATATGSVINIGDGSADITFRIENDNAELTNYAGNSINLKTGATLLLKSLRSGNNNDVSQGNVRFVNSGEFVHAGHLQMQGNKSGVGGTRSITSNGTYRVSGTNAVLRSNVSTTATANTADIAFTSTGIITGATATDKFTYVNSTGQADRDILFINQTGGQIAAGNGTGGSGTSSIGALSFTNANITLAGATTLSFDIGGTVGSGLYDSLLLTGNGAVLTLGSGGILDIRLVNGFTPAAGTYVLANATSVGGTFASMLLNGGAANGAYSVNYEADSLSITFAPIPESASWGIFVGLGACLTVWNRRRRAA